MSSVQGPPVHGVPASASSSSVRKCSTTGATRLSRVTWKSQLKSLPCEEYHGNSQPIRSRYAAKVAYGARDTATSVVLRTCSWRSRGSWSAADEQLGHA